MTNLFNHGQIAQLPFPDGWFEVDVKRHDFEQATLKEFAKKEGHLCFYYRGLAASESGASAFSKILADPAHHLTASEIADNREILGDTADDSVFKILDARTEDFNGRRVLAVEGRWLQKQLDMYKIFIDARNDGSIVQEIYFFAPPALYAGMLSEVKSLLRSIQWKVQDKGKV